MKEINLESQHGETIKRLIPEDFKIDLESWCKSLYRKKAWRGGVEDPGRDEYIVTPENDDYYEEEEDEYVLERTCRCGSRDFWRIMEYDHTFYEVSSSDEEFSALVTTEEQETDTWTWYCSYCGESVEEWFRDELNRNAEDYLENYFNQ